MTDHDYEDHEDEDFAAKIARLISEGGSDESILDGLEEDERPSLVALVRVKRELGCDDCVYVGMASERTFREIEEAVEEAGKTLDAALQEYLTDATAHGRGSWFFPLSLLIEKLAGLNKAAGAFRTAVIAALRDTRHIDAKLDGK